MTTTDAKGKIAESMMRVEQIRRRRAFARQIATYQQTGDPFTAGLFADPSLTAGKKGGVGANSGKRRYTYQATDPGGFVHDVNRYCRDEAPMTAHVTMTAMQCGWSAGVVVFDAELQDKKSEIAGQRGRVLVLAKRITQ